MSDFKVLHTTVVLGSKWKAGALIAMSDEQAKPYIEAGLIEKAKPEDGPGVQADPRLQGLAPVNLDPNDDHKTFDQLQEEGLDKPGAIQEKALAQTGTDAEEAAKVTETEARKASASKNSKRTE